MGVFNVYLHCTNGTKSRKASQIIDRTPDQPCPCTNPDIKVSLVAVEDNKPETSEK